jgi:nitric oxide reductase subunit B
LNVGLALMVVTNLFPGGVLQLLDVLQHGYWHARSPAFLRTNVVQMIEWLRLPGDAIFIGAGVVPAVIAAALTYRSVRRASL